MEPRYFFNRPDFLTAQPEPVHFLTATHAGAVEARWAVVVRDGVGHSVLRGPFGGIEFSAAMSGARLAAFVAEGDVLAARLGLRALRLRLWPARLNAVGHARLLRALTTNGYRIASVDLDYCVPTHQPFEATIDRNRQRTLRGYSGHSGLLNDLSPEAAYAFLERSRTARGIPLTMSRTDFVRTAATFPNEYLFFGSRVGTTLTGLIVAVRIAPDVLYSFYAADHPEHRRESPTTAVYATCHAWARTHGFRYLLLGVATDGGRPNYGLMRFKASLGGQATLKLIVEKLFKE